jgi:glycosyltransferase involved in cell wall biosynthesis
VAPFIDEHRGWQGGDGISVQERQGTLTALSIITPSYNHAPFLPRCLSSVDAVAAAAPEVEHIVVDDASSDDSLAILETWPHHTLNRRILRHECNRGLSATLNTALAEARGTWIGWLNSDDAYVPTGLQRALEELPRLSRDIGLLFGDVKLIDENGGDAGILRMYRGATSCLPLGYNPLLVPSVLFRRDLLPEGFDEHYRLLVDFDLYSTVLATSRARYLPYVIGEWRTHAAQQSVNPRPTDREEWIYLARKFGYRFSSGPTRIGRTWQRVLKLTQLRYLR